MSSPQELVAFWNACKGYPGPLTAGTVVDLGVTFLGGTKKLFVRESYEKMLPILVSQLENQAHPRVLVRGTPGIGKTHFGLFLLLYYARQNATVVYQNGPMNTCYLFSPTVVYTSQGVEVGVFGEHLKGDTIYLVDSFTPNIATVRSILLTSPRKGIWDDFYKHSTSLFMPIWSWDEMELLRSLLYPSLGTTQVKEKYDRWGGVPRYVLEFFGDEEKQKKLDAVINSSDLEMIEKAVGETDGAQGTSHLLVHMVVLDDSTFQSKTHRFASDYVCKSVFDRLLQGQREKFVAFLRGIRDLGEAGGMRGHMFEPWAHKLLLQGGKFQVRNLRTGDRDTLTLPGLQLKQFESLNDVADCDKSTYCVPVSKRFEAIDSFIKPDKVFQMTVSKTHPCKMRGLEDVVKILNHDSSNSSSNSSTSRRKKPKLEPHTVRLYFVVPKEIFSTIGIQLYANSDKEKSPRKNQDFPGVEQWALMIEI